MQNFKNTIKHLKLKNSWKNKAIGKMILMLVALTVFLLCKNFLGGNCALVNLVLWLISVCYINHTYQHITSEEECLNNYV